MGIVYDRAQGMGPNAIEHSHPDKVGKILRMTAEGFTTAEIMREADVSRGVVHRIQRNYCDATEAMRKLAATEYWSAGMRFAELVKMRADQLYDDPEDLRRVNPKDLSVAAKNLMGTAMPLAGMASDIREVRSEVSLEDAQRMIEAARAKTKEAVIEAEVVE